MAIKLFRKVLAVGIIVLFFCISIQPVISKGEYIVLRTDTKRIRYSNLLKTYIALVRSAAKNIKYQFDENLRINNIKELSYLEPAENKLIKGFCLFLYLTMYLMADIIFFIYFIFTDYDTWKIIDIIENILQPINDVYNYFDCHNVLDNVTDNSWIDNSYFLGKTKLSDCPCMQE